MKLKIFISIFVCSFLSANILLSQKVKFDDDVVLVDKVKKYDFLRTKKGGMTGLSNAILKDLQGEEILILKDTSLYYDKLPNEPKNREAVFTNYFEAPKLGKVVLVPGIISYNIRKEIVNALEDYGFFKTDVLDEEIFQKLVNKFEAKEFLKTQAQIDTINIERFKVAKIVENTFGPLLEREPGKPSYFGEYISDGKLRVGRYALDVKGKYASTYKILNSKGAHVASLTIIPSESRANVWSVLEDKRRYWFYFKSKNSMTPPTAYDMEKYFFEQCTKYVIDIGYL